MLAKLMKYDMRATKRYGWIIGVILGTSTLIASFIFRFCFEYIDRDSHSVFPVYTTIAVLVYISYIIIISLSSYGLIIPMFIRFYKHLYSDEGYLTFTLPAKRSTILLSKTVNMFIWQILYFIAVGICLCVLAIIAPPSIKEGQIFNPMIYEGIAEVFKFLWKEIGAWLILYIIEAILFFMASMFYGIALLEFCITTGSVVAKKHKVLASVGIYIGVSAIISVIAQFLSFFFQMTISLGGIEILAKLSEQSALVCLALAIFAFFAAFATFSFAFYLSTLNILERKLNLA